MYDRIVACTVTVPLKLKAPVICILRRRSFSGIVCRVLEVVSHRKRFVSQYYSQSPVGFEVVRKKGLPSGTRMQYSENGSIVQYRLLSYTTHMLAPLQRSSN